MGNTTSSGIPLVPNEGQVKINTGNSLKPTIVWDGVGPNPIAGEFARIEYAPPLGLASAPTTLWPRNILNPSDADIYDFVNNTFIENKVLGQNNGWRCSFSFSGKPAGAITGVEVEIRNTLSGFSLVQTIAIPSERTAGDFSVLLFTIADANSLPTPLGTGQGYEIRIAADDNITVEVDSITRFNFQKNC